MDDDVQRLVLAPFQEMVEKSKEAVANAEEAEPPTSDEMRKVGQSLVREGERALKKIEPLCGKHWDEYGANFVTALKENDELAAFRTDLNDLVWDFDAFIEVDDFEADEFAKLQALARKSAKAMYEILMRMKLEHPPVRFADFDSADISRTTSLAGHSHVAEGPIMASTEPVPEEVVVDQGTPAVERTATDTLLQPTTMSAQAGPDLGYDARTPEAAREQNPPTTQAPQPEPLAPQQRTADSVLPEEIPPEPSVNPWDPAIKPPTPADASLLEGVARRPRQPDTEDEQGLKSPVAASNAFGETDGAGPARRLPDGVAVMMHQVEAEQRSWSQGLQERPGRPGYHHVRNGSSRDDRATLPSQRLAEIYAPPNSPPAPPTVDPTGRTPPPPPNYGGQQHGPITPPTPEPSTPSFHRNSQASLTTDSFKSIPSETTNHRDSLVSPVTVPRPGLAEGGAFDPSASFASIPEDRQPVMSAGWRLRGARQQAEQPGLIPIERSDEQPGLMPVVGGDAAVDRRQTPVTVKREPNCAINVDSSFYQLRGFCDGAKEIIRGGVGVKKVRTGGISAGGLNQVAKCKSCLFELDWHQVEADSIALSPSSNHANTNIGFRLRFISKSHLPSRTVDEQLYGCLFCVQLGRTSEESDATVFFTQKQLFSHLARHARPLPQVPGLTVVESPEVPARYKDNYDLHFYAPRARSLMAGLEREMAQMPTAVAVEAFRRTHGAIRQPPGGGAVLQFCAGQRIVGIEFPARYGGEWGVGWADNVRGAFPADVARLDVPEEVRRFSGGAGAGNSNLRAMARWKRHPGGKDTGGWLRFDRGEVITGICFPYPEHWCWYGCNARGKFGVFPQSYVEPNTLSEAPAADKTSIRSHDSGKGGVAGAIAKLSSIRRRDTRPLSVAGSHSSGETVQAYSPRPAIH